MKKRIVFGVLFILMGVLLVLAPNHLAPGCEPMANGKFMKCHWMGQAVIGQGIIVIATGLVFIILKNEMIALGISISNIVVGIVTILLPLYLIGTCEMPVMSCNTHTKPTVYLLAGIYILLNIIYIFIRDKNKSKI